jgi:hypothetical protein
MPVGEARKEFETSHKMRLKGGLSVVTHCSSCFRRKAGKSGLVYAPDLVLFERMCCSVHSRCSTPRGYSGANQVYG